MVRLTLKTGSCRSVTQIVVLEKNLFCIILMVTTNLMNALKLLLIQMRIMLKLLLAVTANQSVTGNGRNLTKY